MIKFAATIAALYGQAAFSDTWSAFEERCLSPLEEVMAFDLSGLAAIKDVDEKQTYSLDDVATLVIGHEPISCELQVNDFGTAPLVWAERVIAAGRYVEVLPTLSHGPLLLQSTEWREPKIEVLIHWFTQGETQTVLAIETDLES